MDIINKLSSSHRLVYAFLSKECLSNGLVELSLKDIMRELSLSRATIARAIKEFQELGLIEVKHSMGHKNKYYIK